MEQVFFRLHVRFVTAATRFLDPTVRKGLEYLSFANAFCLLGLLVWLHLAFVNPNPQTHCLAQYSKGKAMSLTEADVVKIHISSRWSSPSCISCRNPDTSKADLPEDLQRLRPDLLSDIPTLFETFTDAIGMHYDDSPRKKADVSKQPVLDVIRQAQFMQSSSVWAEYEASLFDLFLRDKVYLFSREKGFLMLRSDIRAERNVTQLSITIPRDAPCLGNPLLRATLDHMIGHDTVVMNWIISSLGGHGYLYNVYSKELFNLNYAAEFEASTEHWERFVVFKVGVLFTTLFLFFTTTTLVSFTLRETQERMLKFTFLLQYHVRHRLPYAPLIFTHVVESLVFVPIMVGILFFLFEFFSDQLLAFMVLSLVWLCEVYSVVAVRTKISISFFPRFFFLYFTLFHVYFFSFPFGFSYMALLATAMLLQHIMLYFWNGHEVPALQHGVITATRPRVMMVAMQAFEDVPQTPEAVTPQPAASGGAPVRPVSATPPAAVAPAARATAPHAAVSTSAGLPAGAGDGTAAATGSAPATSTAGSQAVNQLSPLIQPSQLLASRLNSSFGDPSATRATGVSSLPATPATRNQAILAGRPPALTRHASDSNVVVDPAVHVEMSRRIQRAQMQQLMSAQYGVQLGYDYMPDEPLPPPTSRLSESDATFQPPRAPLLGRLGRSLWNMIPFADGQDDANGGSSGGRPRLPSSTSTPALSELDRDDLGDLPLPRRRLRQRRVNGSTRTNAEPPIVRRDSHGSEHDDPRSRSSSASVDSAGRIRSTSYSPPDEQRPAEAAARRNTMGDISRNTSYNDFGFNIFGNVSYFDDDDDSAAMDESYSRAHDPAATASRQHNGGRASSRSDSSDRSPFLWGPGKRR